MNWYLKVLKEYVNFSGRARRKEYWMFVLFNMIAGFVVGFIGGMIHLPILGLIYNLAVLIPSIAVGVRRMHDTNHSGWFLLIPLYNLYLAVIDGDSGTNRFGPNPKAAE